MPGETLIDTDAIAISEAVATTPSATFELLHRQIADADTQWSLGTFGGIAEFSRGRDEPVSLSQSPDGVSAVTARGGIAITCNDGIRPFASESITKKTGWSHRIALCLPADDCAMNRRNVLTELGSDRDALRPEDRGAILFDLGLGALQADLCVRFDDPGTITQLRTYAGRSLFEAGNPAMGLILQANPHRVFMSRIGRIEVYQSIPPTHGTSPEGPHTHVLPKLLNSGRTHPATEPIPEGWIPCAHLYPPHPARDDMGRPLPFDVARHEAFQRLLGTYGLAESLAIKRRVLQAIEAGERPAELAQGRDGRINVRIALRQMKFAGHGSPALQAWLAEFDPVGSIEDDDEHQAAAHC
jgi:hypothetical protein